MMFGNANASALARAFRRSSDTTPARWRLAGDVQNVTPTEPTKT
jgi:hypothetical protein